ncbi:hypothetical protein NUACC26_059670 [Scytonema sp. NUACC26]
MLQIIYIAVKMSQPLSRGEIAEKSAIIISLITSIATARLRYMTSKKTVIMLKRSKFETTQSQIMYRAEELISAASNRYRITVQVANRAKRRRYEDFDSADDAMMKPVLRAIIEMSDELTQPEIIGEV